MNRILVIGGTGNVGRHVVDQLRAAGARFRVMSRDPDAAGLPPQVEVVCGDLTIPETLDPCLEGVETVFLTWVAPPAAAPGALERIANHARRIVFLRGGYRNTGTDLPRMGDRSRRGIPGMNEPPSHYRFWAAFRGII